MNKVYRTVFNETTNTWVAVAEISPAKGKKSRSEKSSGGIGLHLMAPVMVSGMLLSGHAMAAHLQDGTGTNAITIYGAGVTTTEATGADSFAAGTGTKVYSQSGIALGTNAVSGDSGNSNIKNTVAIGNLAKAEGGNAIAMGQNATAKKQSDLAIGDGAKATQGQGTAVGVSASAEGAGASAYGYLTKATGYLSTAIGNQAESSGSSSVAVGKALASGPQAIAIGNDAKSTSTQTIAVGNAADVGGSQFGIAIGSGAKLNTDPAVTGKNTAIAIGYQAEATDLDANAFGRKANATGQTSLAIGAESAAKGISSIAVGSNTKADDEDGIAIGNKAATGAGHNNTAVGSYSEANVGWSTALGTRAYTNANGALAAGTMASAEGQRATAIGSFSFAEGLTSTALGYNAIATQTATSGTAMGTGTVIDGKMSGAWAAAPHANPHQYDNTKRSIVGGEGNYAIGNENIVGNLTKNSVVFGNKIKIGADGATLTSTNPAGQGNSIKSREEAVTYTNATALENVVAIGNSSKVTVSNGVALGSNSVASVDKEEEGSDPLNAGTNKQDSTWKATHAAVSVGDGTDVTRQITSVAAGKNDTDAVNVAQLKAAGFELSVSQTGGGSSEDKTQSSNLSDKKVKNGETVTVDAGKNIKVTQTGKTVSIATKDEVEFTKITLGDTANNTVLTSTADGLDVGGDKITNVAKGTADTDAVNVSQLKGAADALGGGAGVNTDGTFKAPSYTITKTDGTSYTPANNVGEALSNLNAEVIKPITFAGDSGANSTRKLGETLTIKGGATGTLTAGNIGVESDGNGTLTAKLAQNIDLGDNGSVQTGNTKLDKDGLAITNSADSTKNVNLTSGGLNNGGNKITNVAKGTADNDAVNVSQLKDAQAAATSKVIAGDGITVTNTPNTDGSTTYKVAADTTPLTVTNGKVTPPTENDAGKLVTAGDIAKTINNSGFQATAGGNLASGTNATPTTVKPGQKVTFAAGNGLTVKQDIDNASGNQTYTYALDAQSVVQDAQLPVVYTKADGSKVYKQPDGKFYDAPTGGNEVAAGDVIASMQDAAGSTTAPTTLANVKSNLADAGNAVTNPAGNSRADLAGKGNNAATVNDVLNSGFTVQGNGQNKDFVTHGDTINFANGQGTVANVTSTNGVTTVKFDTPMTYADASGNPTSTPSNKVNLVGGTAGSPVTLGNVADGTVAAGSKEAVNGSQLHATNQNVANNAANIAKGINFGGTTGSNNYQLGDTINVKGDSNITSTTVAGGAQLALNPNLNVTSVTTTDAAGNKTVTNGSGVTITPASGNPVSLTTGGLNNGGNKITNVAAGTDGTDAVNVDQLKAAKAAATTKVKAGNGISVNGTQNADGSTTYTVAADTTPLTVANGKVTPPAAADANKLATAGDIANAINNSGFQATAGGNLASGTNATPTTVKPGQKVTFAAGNGLTVKQDIDNASGNQTYTYALDAQSVVQDAQLPVVYTKADGSKVYKQPDGKFYDAPTGGNEVAAGDVIASMQDAAGSTTAPTTLANVKSNLADAGNAVTNPAGNSRADLAGKGNNAATVNDVLNSGFTVQGNGQNKDFVTHGDTINFANGQGTVANVTSTNGVTTVKFDTPMTYADASGNPTSTPSNKVNLVGGTAGSPVTLGNVADGTVAAGSKEAVNGSQLHATNQNVANNAANIAKGINFGGTTGSNNYQLGDTINVKGDSNITSTTVAGGAQLALNPNLNVTSVTTTDAAGNKTVTNGSGVTITPASGNPVSLTTGGLNNGGNKITNVAAGTDGTDAVNVSQLNQALGSITGANTANFTALNNKVNEVAADAKAGTAAAMAVAGLPQAYLPGKSMMAVGGSVYRGESGYAIGYSTISDGGNWIVKGTATGNSRGHYGATAAVGYQW
ncbi:YadA-like family protein [Neisseria elongata]|uniref:YadA-like family protein n=1 Tax=Neisseria elongata TaxID=495 RepID=UPI000D381C7E|nr:YadA-like family protein [Neisseria elongata]